MTFVIAIIVGTQSMRIDYDYEHEHDGEHEHEHDGEHEDDGEPCLAPFLAA